MPDIFSKQKRSAVMSAIRSHGNKSTEARLLEIIRDQKFVGWRRRLRMPGSPDYAFPELKLAMFVDGCFWHGCPTHGHYPKGNALFWLRKITRNKARDRRIDRQLWQKGWRVLHVWEHELKRRDEAKLIGRLERAGITRSHHFRSQVLDTKKPRA